MQIFIKCFAHSSSRLAVVLLWQVGRVKLAQDDSSQRCCGWTNGARPGLSRGHRGPHAAPHPGLAVEEGRGQPRRRAQELPDRSQLPEAALAAAPGLRCRLLLSSGDSKLVAVATRTSRCPPSRAGTPHGGTTKQLITAPQPICWCGS